MHLKGTLDRLSSGLDVSKIAFIDEALRHNQLLIMFPPQQECFTHEIVKAATVPRHPISGETRISLTLRRYKETSAQPNCRCGRPAILKAKAPGNEEKLMQVHSLRYYWSCDIAQTPTCGWSQPASELAIDLKAFKY